MFRIYRSVAVAIGLTLFALNALAQEQQSPALESEPVAEPRQEESTSTSQDNSEQENRQSIDYLPSLQGIESAIRDLIAEEDKIERERQQQQEIRDLNAQEDMALWAERMFWATVATVVLTFVALFAIIRTLHHTRRAADSADGMLSEAKDTTKAAVKQSETALKQLQFNQRPKLRVRQEKLTELKMKKRCLEG